MKREALTAMKHDVIGRVNEAMRAHRLLEAATYLQKLAWIEEAERVLTKYDHQLHILYASDPDDRASVSDRSER